MSSEINSVPYLNLTTEFAELETEWLESIRAIGKTGAFVMGPNVSAFEEEVAKYIGVKHAIGVANGTDALVLSLRALGIGPGDEVITTPYTFFATSESIDLVGATPVFADILENNYTLDPKSVREKISDKTRAIMPVHIFGCPTDMDAINKIAQENNLRVIEDAAQAFGASWGGNKVGSLGNTGCFSFYPTKVLGCYGDGGLITTNDDEIADHIRRLKNHGASKPFMHTEVGYNSRLDEIHASLLRLKLKAIDGAISARQKAAAAYSNKLSDKILAVPTVPASGVHAYNLYTTRLVNRDVLRQRLIDHQIGQSLCYPLPLHLQDVYQHLGYATGSLPVSEKASQEALSLPIYPGIPQSHIDHICEILLQN